MNDLHPSFWAALAGWLLAQSIKMISCFIRSGKLDFSFFGRNIIDTANDLRCVFEFPYLIAGINSLR